KFHTIRPKAVTLRELWSKKTNYAGVFFRFRHAFADKGWEYFQAAFHDEIVLPDGTFNARIHCLSPGAPRNENLALVFPRYLDCLVFAAIIYNDDFCVSIILPGYTL